VATKSAREVVANTKKLWERVMNSGCIKGWDRPHCVRREKQSASVCSPEHSLPVAKAPRRRLQKKRPKVVDTGERQTRVAEDRISTADLEFAESPPRLIQADGANKACLAILPDGALGDQLLQVMEQNRTTGKANDQAYERLDDLDRRFNNVSLEVDRLRKKISTLEDCPPDEGRQDLLGLQQELRVQEHKQDNLERKRKAVDQAVKERQGKLGRNTNDFFTALRNVFVDGGVIKVNEDASSETSDSSSDDERPCRLLLATEAKADPEEELRGNYRWAKRYLYSAEDRLEDRYIEFEQLAEQRQQKELTAGEGAETSTAFGRRLFDLTRSYTQDIATAEAKVEAAKTAAIAAGVQLEGSDIDSRFLDDVNDGYRVSYDEAMMSLTNPGSVEKWLAGVPDAEVQDDAPETSDTAVESAGPVDGIDDVESDGWEAASVQICDSASLVAEGRWRQKIDGWREKCAMEG